jgi:tetratricopeptide (TPR) repeat protein
MKQAKLLRLSGRVEEAIPVLRRAADLIQVSEEPWLSFALKKNLMVYLSQCGRAEEAQRLLPEVRQLAKTYGSRLERLRLLWTEGLMRKELGQVELAIEVLEQVREGFIASDIGYDAASVSLDIASLYIETGRTEEARQLATESIPLFTARGVHREAVVAWTLFREAAERDALTLGLVQEVASRIRQSQSHPTAEGDLP